VRLGPAEGTRLPLTSAADDLLALDDAFSSRAQFLSGNAERGHESVLAYLAQTSRALGR
jgi:hypothetical protein